MKRKSTNFIRKGLKPVLKIPTSTLLRLGGGIAALVVVFFFSFFSPAQLVASEGQLSQSLPVVVLMDSPDPDVVYDPITREEGGTNADDIERFILRDLPLQLCKEIVTPHWSNKERILHLNPDLIIIHWSAFYGFTNPADEDAKFSSFLQDMASSRAKFLIYSRAPGLNRPDDKRRVIRRYESLHPLLRGRINFFILESGPAATFRDQTTGQRLKRYVLLLTQTGNGSGSIRETPNFSGNFSMKP